MITVAWRRHRAQCEVVDADHPGHPPDGQRDPQQRAQSRVTRQIHRGYRQQTCPSSAVNSLTMALTCLVRRTVRRWYRSTTPGTCSRKVWRQPRGDTPGAAPAQHTDHHPPFIDRHIGRHPPVIAVHAFRRSPAHRADRSVPRSPCPHHDPLTLVGHIFDDQRGEARKHRLHELVDILRANLDDPYDPPSPPNVTGPLN
jgi:hypothetical protein